MGEDLTQDTIHLLEKAMMFKRICISVVNSIFDPIGMLQPLTIIMKVMLKKMFSKENKLDWDEEPDKQMKVYVNAWERPTINRRSKRSAQWVWLASSGISRGQRILQTGQPGWTPSRMTSNTAPPGGGGEPSSICLLIFGCLRGTMQE